MKKIFFLAAVLTTCAASSYAQQKLVRGMNFIPGAKPNNIIYHDTIFRGSAQFMPLFYRTRDNELIRLYQKHQSNKIAGNVLGVAGMLATIIGAGKISSGNSGTAWALIGGGFVTTLTGGYLIFRGQQHLQTAVDIFNNRYNGASLGLGVGEKRAGLVFNF